MSSWVVRRVSIARASELASFIGTSRPMSRPPVRRAGGPKAAIPPAVENDDAAAAAACCAARTASSDRLPPAEAAPVVPAAPAPADADADAACRAAGSDVCIAPCCPAWPRASGRIRADKLTLTPGGRLGMPRGFCSCCCCCCCCW
eukprot:364183-Chlamydomonas_euryale.AAC.19